LTINQRVIELHHKSTIRPALLHFCSTVMTILNLLNLFSMMIYMAVMRIDRLTLIRIWSSLANEIIFSSNRTTLKSIIKTNWNMRTWWLQLNPTLARNLRRPIRLGHGMKELKTFWNCVYLYLSILVFLITNSQVYEIRHVSFNGKRRAQRKYIKYVSLEYYNISTYLCITLFFRRAI